MKLGVFLAIGESLADFKKKGQDQLMIDYHFKNYSCNFEKVYIFSYTNENIRYFKNVIVIPNKWHLHRYIYALLMPILNYKYIKQVNIIRGFQLSGGIPGIIAKLFFNKKFIINYGYDYVKFAKIENKQIQSFIYSLLLSLVIRFSDKVIITARYLIKSIPKIYRSKIIYIPNGVDTNIFRKIKQKKDIDILYVGRLEKQKNLFTLIKAIGKLTRKNLKIVFVGNGSLKNMLILQANKLKINLKIINSISHNQLPKIYNRSKLFILPSYIEGQPKVLLEAMSCSLPVVASDIPAHREIIENQTNGILCGIQALKISKSIIYLYKHLNIRNKILKNARKTITTNYSKNLLNKLEINLLFKIIANNE